MLRGNFLSFDCGNYFKLTFSALCSDSNLVLDGTELFGIMKQNYQKPMYDCGDGSGADENPEGNPDYKNFINRHHQQKHGKATFGSALMESTTTPLKLSFKLSALPGLVFDEKLFQTEGNKSC